MVRKCLFCNGNDLSKEHVFGQWLLKELNIVNSNFTMTHANFALTPLNKRSQSYNKLVNGKVCKKCNNGWMSRLENTCKDLIISLINAKLTNSTIDELDTKKELLAMWAFKNTLLLNYSVNYRKIIPKSHFKMLYNGKIPQNVIINIAFTENDAALRWFQNIGTPIVYTNKLLDQNEFNEKNWAIKLLIN